jgi:hypothetical protein
MKLHGNAALTLKKRQLLVSRVIEEGWSLASAGHRLTGLRHRPSSAVRPPTLRGRTRC